MEPPSQSSHIHIGSTVELYINTQGHSAGRTTDETDNFVSVSAFLLIMLRFARWWVTTIIIVIILFPYDPLLKEWCYSSGGNVFTTYADGDFHCHEKSTHLSGLLCQGWFAGWKMDSFTRLVNKLRLGLGAPPRSRRWSLLRLNCACLSALLLQKEGADWQCCHWSWHDRRAGEEVSCLMTVVMSNRKRPPRSSNGKPVCHPRPHSWRDEKCWNTVKLLSTVDFFQWCQPIGH